MNISDAARYLVHLSYGDDYYSLTPLKLQKILYYAQGWSYVWDNVSLFNDEFEAWQYGPVNRDVYDQFKKYKGNEISENEGLIPENAEEYELETLRIVWERYGKKTASALVEKTHEEAPWLNVNMYEKITNNSIKKYFQKNY